MPRQNDDIIELGIIHECNGVQAVARTHAKIKVAGTAGLLEEFLNDVATSIWNELGGVMSGQCTFSCLTYVNLRTLERFSVHPMLNGTLEDNHPAHSVVRLNKYADPVSPDTKRYVGGMHFSGTAEPESSAGLVGNESDWDGMRNWLQVDHVYATSGDTIRAVVRHDRTPKPPPPDPDPGRDYHYGEVVHATVKSQYMNLNSRRSKLLCGAGA